MTTASQGILLGGQNDCNDVELYNSMESVVYHNVADVDPGESGDVLTVAVSNAYNSTNPVVGSVWIYNEASTDQLAKNMAVETGIYALNDISLKSNADLVAEQSLLP